MSTLIDPGLPSEDPRQELYGMMSSNSTVVWFSGTAKASQLLTYVAGLLGEPVTELTVVDGAYAITPERNVLVAILRSVAGVAACVMPIADGGPQAIDAAIMREWEAMREALGRGQYRGNDGEAQYAAIVAGQLHPDFEGSDVLDFVNGASIVPLGAR